MRFDTKVYLQNVKAGAYNKQSGDYGEDTVTETEKYASVTTTGEQTINLIYGKLIQGVYTVRIRGKVNTPDYIRIGDNRYRVDSKRKLRIVSVFIVSEVQ